MTRISWVQRESPTLERQLERWFNNRGLARMLDGTVLKRSTAVNAAPGLVVVFVVALLLIVPDLLPVSLLQSLVITIPVLVASWVVSNLLRRAPVFGPVREVGWFEALVFVVVPTIVVGVASRTDRLTTGIADENGSIFYLPSDWVLNTAATMLVQILLLLFVIGLAKSGLLSVTHWLAREAITGVPGSAGALAGALPVLLGVVFFFFLNPGVWVSVGRLDTNAYGLLIGLLVLLSAAFLGSRKQLDVDRLATFEAPDDLRQALAETPLAEDPATERTVATMSYPVRVPLSHRQSANVRLVAILSRLVIATVVAAAVFTFFTVLGLIVVDAEVVTGWTRQSPDVLWQWRSPYRTYIISAQELRVAGFLGVFSGFYFSLVSATDGRLRTDAYEAATDMIREACALRVALLEPAPAQPKA